MSSFNYMENVPVKIAENYKPPPRVYQVPQVISNKFALSARHYQDATQFCYDFQLERKVLAKIPDWRRVRQQDREARRERKEKREQQKMREVEAQQKQLLGAVSYPSAEELSSTESDEEDDSQKTEVPPKRRDEQTCSFHNILQPTILPRSSSGIKESNRGADLMAVNLTAPTHAGNVWNAAEKLSSMVFNYKDFEDDTSSPFDNIELKTINDLDILAQVLHQTQLKSKELQQQESKEIMSNTENRVENVENSNEDALLTSHPNSTENGAINLETLKNAKIALEKVDFNDSSQQLQYENIPISNNFVYNASNFASQQTQQNSHAYNKPYDHISNGLDLRQQQYSNFNATPLVTSYHNNQNYLYTPNCNGGDNSSTFLSSTHAPPTHFLCNNANNYLSLNPTANITQVAPLPSITQLTESDLVLKSKSVPDILRELSEEVRNSELRRARNHSYNLNDSQQLEEKQENTKKDMLQQKMVETKLRKLEAQYYTKLEASAQKLAKNISLMGFPLERVAKIAQMFGADDKKIIEHLIPLSELMDLGFEEGKISEALVKFDNNKEKALEYLIS